MNDLEESKRVSVLRLILVPSLVSVGVTLLRLLGELQGWSPGWFSPEAGGVKPSGVSWIIGITWLPIFFGAYFALKLAAAGRGPERAGRAILWAMIGVAILAAFFFGVMPRVGPGMEVRVRLLTIWAVGVVAGALQFVGWRDLARTLLAYGLVSRAFVALVMLFAMLGRWGTHYDYGREPDVVVLPFSTKFWWLAFFPQIVFWVGFTVVLGSLSGSLTYALFGRRLHALRPVPAAS